MKEYYRNALLYLKNHLNDLTLRSFLIGMVAFFLLAVLMGSVSSYYRFLIIALQVLIPVLVFRYLVSRRLDKLIKSADWKHISSSETKEPAKSILDFLPASQEQDQTHEEEPSRTVIPLKKSGAEREKN